MKWGRTKHNPWHNRKEEVICIYSITFRVFAFVMRNLRKTLKKYILIQFLASGKNQSHQKRQNNHAIKKNVAPKTNEGDNEKIHYVLNPKKIKERLVEAKQKEHREKEKSYQKQS